MDSFHKHIFLAIIGLIALAGVSLGAKKTVGVDADRLKASYIFFEAESHLRDGDAGTAYYLYRRAAALDPHDVDIAAALGELTIVAGLGDSTEFESAYNAIGDRFFSNPEDYQSGIRYARVAEQLRRFDDVRDVYRELCRVYPDRPDYSLQYAWYKALDYRRGDSTAIDSAMVIYDRIEKGTGIDMNLTIHRIRTLSLAGDTAEMVAEIVRYFNNSPHDAEVNFAAGRMFEYIDLPDSAIAYFNRACDLDSTMGEAYLARAEYYLGVGDSARYDTEVVHALESPTLDFEPKFEILTNYTRALFEDKSRHDMLSSLFGRMLDIHPGEARLHSLYGAFLATIHKPAEATEQFGYASDLEPENEDYWRFKMGTSLESGDTLEAIATAAGAARRFENVYYPVYAASLLTVSKQHEKAMALLDSFDITDKDYAPEALSVFYQTRGDIFYAMEKRDSAFVNYEKAIDLNPANVGALNNVAYYMSVDGRELDKAESYIQRAILAEPLNPTFIDTYAWVLFKKGDYDGARKQIDAVLNIYSDSTEVMAFDTIMEATPMDSVCEVHDPNCVSVDSIDVEPAEDLVGEAEVVEEVVEEIEPEKPSAEIFDHAGDIYFATGEPDKAIEYWKQALEIEPDNEKIKEKIKKKKIDIPAPSRDD